MLMLLVNKGRQDTAQHQQPAGIIQYTTLHNTTDYHTDCFFPLFFRLCLISELMSVLTLTLSQIHISIALKTEESSPNSLHK